jgi:hypothetical protein
MAEGIRVEYKKAPDRPRDVRYAARAEARVTSLEGNKPERISNIQAKFWRPYAAGVSAGLGNAKAEIGGA